MFAAKKKATRLKAVKKRLRSSRRYLSSAQNLALIFAILTPTLSTLYLEIYSTKLYKLSDTEKTLVAKTSVKKELIKDTDGAFLYNRKEELNLPNGNDPKLQQLLLSAKKEDSTGKEPYQAKLSKDPTEGITFGDAEGNRQFTITPEYGLSTGRMDEDNRIVYPSSSTERHIYTFKKNGIKNDITLLEAPSADPNSNGSTRTYTYTLDLGKDLEAKQLPSGDIGIYSADPTLFGNIQVGDQKSQELIDKARTNNQKNTLAFEIPRPFILDSNQNKNYDDVSFKLVPNQKDQTKPTLELQVRNLQNLPYPLTIDPTITVTTTADFQQNIGNNDNIDYSTDGQITRGTIGSGALGTSGTPSTFTVSVYEHSSVVYNGYLYIIGGLSTPNNDIQYCPINVNGTVNSCTVQTGVILPNDGNYYLRNSHTSVAYNGYLYIIGGYQNANLNNQNDIQYCPINANGSVGTCTQQTNAFTGARYGHTSVAYNGYLYIIGGFGNLSINNDIQYCPINANGSVGTCTQQTNAFTGARYRHTSVVYNGYLYIIGGTEYSYVGQNDIQYCPINANGSVGTCTQQTNAFTGARHSHTSVIYNGYLYIIGGYVDLPSNDIQYCPINANGSVGTCTQRTNAFTTARYSHTSVIYNGYLYIIGGTDNSNNLNDIQNIKIESGRAGPKSSTTSITNNRSAYASVAYNGYIYIIGGWNGTNYYNDIQRAQVQSDGTLSSWITQSGAFVGPRYGHSAVVHGGNLYIIGGSTPTGINKEILWCSINQYNGSIGSDCSPASGSATIAGDYSMSYFIGNGTNGTSGRLYTAHRWNSTGTFSPSTTTSVEYLCVGGGGGGAGNFTSTTLAAGGGGGAGGLVHNVGGALQAIPSGSQTITVGTKGTGLAGGATVTTANSGTGSSIGSLVSCAGGGGGGRGGGGANGGSGGGAAAVVNSNGTFNGGTATPAGQGNNGGTSIRGGGSGDVSASGGGGKNSVGGNSSNTNAGNGGSSISLSITGSAVDYAGGGGGGRLTGDGGGTSGGAGAGAGGAYQTAGSSASIANTGSGGGGAGADLSGVARAGGDGSDGVVVIRYTSPNSATFNTARHLHTSFVYNGYLYIVGGSDGTFLSSTESCVINASGSIGTCTQTASNLTVPRADHASAVFGNKLYLSGGATTGNSLLNSIEVCTVNTNGTISSCSTSAGYTTSTARRGLGSVINNGYLYILGGGAGSRNATVYNDIQYCPVANDGTLGTCSTQSNVFTTPRSHFQPVHYSGMLYAVAGWSGSTDTVTSEYVRIGPSDSGGRVGSTTTDPDSYFSIPRYDHSSVAYNGYLYVIGGAINSSDTTCKNSGTSQSCNDIQYAPINANGSIGTWTTNSTYFNIPRYAHKSVAYNGYLYVIGGIQSSGSTTCKNSDSSQYCNDIQYAPINANGSIGTWTTNSTYFNIPRSYHTSVVYNGYLYVIGGFSNSSASNCKNSGTNNLCNDIQYALICTGNNSGLGGCGVNAGTVGTWITNSTYFSFPRYNHTSVVYNGYLYVIGGNQTKTDTDCKNSGTDSLCNDIQYAPINANGSIGTWATNSTYFNIPRSNFTSVVYNGYIYVSGGLAISGGNACDSSGNSNTCNDIQYAPINTNGSVGTWATNSNYFSFPRSNFTSVANNGYIYVIGGSPSSGGTTCKDSGSGFICNDTQYLPLVTYANIARYERTIDTGSIYQLNSFTITGSSACNYVVSYEVASNNAIYSASTTLFNVASGVPRSISGGSDKRYIALVITVDDSSCGGTSTITSIALEYIRPPSPPTLSQPTNGATSVSSLPQFRLGSTDADSDYLRYKIEVCSDSACNSIIRTIDQTSSQTGWTGQTQQTGTAYASGPSSIVEYAVHNYQSPTLTPNTTYYWRGYAIDPGGSNTWSSASSIWSFRTLATSSQNDTKIYGGSTIYGGTKVN